jgi:hypothetical protein
MMPPAAVPEWPALAWTTRGGSGIAAVHGEDIALQGHIDQHISVALHHCSIDGQRVTWLTPWVERSVHPGTNEKAEQEKFRPA